MTEWPSTSTRLINYLSVIYMRLVILSWGVSNGWKRWLRIKHLHVTPEALEKLLMSAPHVLISWQRWNQYFLNPQNEKMWHKRTWLSLFKVSNCLQELKIYHIYKFNLLAFLVNCLSILGILYLLGYISEVLKRKIKYIKCISGIKCVRECNWAKDRAECLKEFCLLNLSSNINQRES